MSAYENVICEKLKLKGKALTVRSGGIDKKKKHKKFNGHHNSPSKDLDKSPETQNRIGDENLTPAERRYLRQWEEIERRRLEKMASKSHRDRIQEFNQYLANLSEHYDIPKVGPG